MKKTIRTIAIFASLALPLAFASTGELKAQTSPAQGECTPENKLAWYTEFRSGYNSTNKATQGKAYDLAQKYLACPEDPSEDGIRKYLRNFVNLIDKSRRPDKVYDLVYVKKDYAKAFELGKQVLTDEPDNARVLMDLAYAGYLATTSKVEGFSAESLVYAKKAIQLIQAGTVPGSWDPYANKDEALGYLNNAVGVLTLAKNPGEALPYLLKAAQFEGKLKKQAITYGYIGDAYQSGPYDKLSADYKRFLGLDETPESKLALENINQVVDRMIDAYARAVALSGTDPAYAARKTAWMETLTTWYKYRHNQSDAGLTDLIAGVMAKPLPAEPTPLTTLPAPTTSSTPTPTSTNAAGSTTTPGAVIPTAIKPATTPATTATTAPKPAATTTEAAVVKPKPKTRNNHRRP